MNLDDDYANAAYIKNAASFPQMWADRAAIFREHNYCELGVAYGLGERQTMDLFFPKQAPKGLFVFVHGGYWLKFDRSSWSHLAGAAISRGWAVAIPSYDLAPKARIFEMTLQIAQAVTVAAEKVAGPIALAGHSAGGQLVARMVCPGVLGENVVNRVTQVVPISPVSDLRPLMHTSMNSDLKLDEEECASESPALLLPRDGLPVTVWVGADERPVFLAQSKQLADAWECDCVTAVGKHHFDVLEPLEDPNSVLSQLLLCVQEA